MNRKLFLFMISMLLMIVFVDNEYFYEGCFICMGILLILKFNGSNVAVLLVTLLGFVFGGVYLDFYKTTHYYAFKEYLGRSVEVYGEVVSYAEKVSDRKVKIIIKDKEIGRILIYLDKYPSYYPGNILAFEGVLEEAPEFEDFSYKRHLQTEGIFYVIRNPVRINLIEDVDYDLFNWVADFKTSRLDSIRQRFSYPSSAVIEGMAFGIRANFSEKFKSTLSITGTMHIVAISGFNISVLFSGLMLFGHLMQRKIFNSICILLLIFFIVFIGFYNYSAFRAVIFSAVSLIGKLIGRRVPVSNIVSISILAILIFNPMAYRSAGFLFSISSVLAVTYVSNVFKLGSALSTAFAVSAFTGLLQIYMFKSFSILGILVNLIIAPLVSISTIGSVLYVIMSCVDERLSAVVAIPLSIVVEFMIGVIQIAAKIKFLFVSNIDVGEVWLFVAFSFLVYISFNNFYFTVMDKLSRRQ